MKKLILLIIILFIISMIPIKVYASDNFNDIDSSVNEIIDGIGEDDFKFLVDFLNNFFGDKKTLKERLVLFITGEISLEFDTFVLYLKSQLFGVVQSVLKLLCYVIFIAVSCSVLNIIISKNNDNNAKSIIYFICYFIVVALISKLVFTIFDNAKDKILNIKNTLEICFPMLITLSEFSGGFGSLLFKPIVSVCSFFVSNISTSTFLPILNLSLICVIIGNISSTIKLNSLYKTLLSLVKWILGVLTLVFSIVLAAQGIVNMQYNGLSFKILKYATGSLIPIVGSFISGGLDVLLSSAILVKNSFGLILVVYLLFSTLSYGGVIIIVSFILKFVISLCESLLDSKFVQLINGVCEIFNCLTAVIFICGFVYILVCFSIINSTALII